MEKEYCQACQKIFVKKHKCMREERYTKKVDGQRARSYIYKCKECSEQWETCWMTAKERLDHEVFHNLINNEKKHAEPFSYEIWKMVLSTEMSTESQCEFLLSGNSKLVSRFKGVTDQELCIVKDEIEPSEHEEIATILANQMNFYDKLFELDEFSRERFKDQEIESIVFLTWILSYLKPSKSKQQPKRKYYCIPKVKKQPKIKKKLIKKKKIIESFKRINRTVFIRKELLFNNIIDYFHPDCDFEGKFFFNSEALRLNFFEKMIKFMDDLTNVQKNEKGYRINLSYFRVNKIQILAYLNSFSKTHVLQRIKEKLPKQIKYSLQKDPVFRLLRKEIVVQLELLSEIIANYRSCAVSFKLKFSDFDETLDHQHKNIGKYSFELRKSYSKKMQHVHMCHKEDFDKLMMIEDFQKNISQSLFRSLAKSKVKAERHEEKRMANVLFIKAVNDIRKEQIKNDARTGVCDYVKLKMEYLKYGKIPENEILFSLFQLENSHFFEENVQERIVENQYDSIYFRKTLELCLEFVRDEWRVRFQELTKHAFEKFNYLTLEKYRVRSIFEQQKKRLYQLLERYYSKIYFGKQAILKSLWQEYTWQRPRLQSSEYVLCIDSDIQSAKKPTNEELIFEFAHERVHFTSEEIVYTYKMDLLREDQYAFIDSVVWNFINSAYSKPGIKEFNDRFSFHLIDPNGLPTASFFLKRHRESLSIILSEKIKNIKKLETHTFMKIEKDLQKIEYVLFKEHLEAFKLKFQSFKYLELLAISDSNEMKENITALFEDLLDLCIQNIEPCSIFASVSKKGSSVFSFRHSEKERIKSLNIKKEVSSDLLMFSCNFDDVNANRIVERFSMQIFDKYKNTKQSFHNKIEKVILNARRADKRNISMVYQANEDNCDNFENEQQAIFNPKIPLNSQSIENILENNQLICHKESEPEIEESLELTHESNFDQFNESLDQFEEYDFLEMNTIKREEKLLPYLDFYKYLVNKVDLPFKMIDGKVFRKYPNLWTLKEMVKIKERKRDQKEILTVAEMTDFSKEEKGLLKFRKCGVCMTRKNLNYCCMSCLTLYHEKCYKSINICFICTGHVHIDGFTKIYISPTLFRFYNLFFEISNNQEAPENKNANFNIIKSRGIHTFENKFCQGFIFRNHFPDILYLTDEIEKKIEKYNTNYCLPFKIGEAKGMGFGCFATENIKKNTYLCEYCGDVMNPHKAKNNEYLYHLWPGYTGMDEYCVCPDSYWSEANFINHSNSPNCSAQTVMSFRGPRILIFTKKEIKKNEQLFYNYNGSLSLYAVNWKD